MTIYVINICLILIIIVYKVAQYRDYKQNKEGYDLIRKICLNRYDDIKFKSKIPQTVSNAEIAYTMIEKNCSEDKAIRECIKEHKDFNRYELISLNYLETRLRLQYKNGQLSLGDLQKMIDN